MQLDYNIKLFTEDFDVKWECNPWGSQPCISDWTVLLSEQEFGNYFLSVQSDNCDEWIPITVTDDGGGCTDSDEDGICDNEDCGPTNSTIPAPIGSTCNDFDSTTINDVIVGDECTCEGVPTTQECNITVTETSFGQITITGLSAVNNTKLFDETASSAGIVWECNPWSGNPCNSTEVIDGLDAGVQYYLSVQKGDCQEWIPVYLTMITFDGEAPTQFATVNDLSSNTFSIANLFPNPAKEETFINIESTFDGEITMQIISMVGKIQQHATFYIEEGNNTVKLNITNLNTGIYHLILNNQKGQSDSIRFVKF